MIAHASAAALRLVADRTGLTQALSDTLYRDDVTPGHDRGRVLVDAAVMMADGGNTIRGIDVLRHQRDLYGAVASAPTLSRALTEIDEAGLHRLDAVRAQSMPDGAETPTPDLAPVALSAQPAPSLAAPAESTTRAGRWLWLGGRRSS